MLRAPGSWQRLAETRVNPLDDRERGLRLAQGQGVAAHQHQLAGLFDQTVDLVGQGGQVVAPDGDALLEEMIGVALFLAGDRVDDDHGQSLGQCLRRGQPARLAHEQVRGRHQLVHLGGEAEQVEIDGRGLRKPPDHAGEPGAKLLVAAADDHDLRRLTEAQKGLDDVLDRADAKASGRNQDREQVLVQTMLAAHGPGILRLPRRPGRWGCPRR